MSFTWKKKNFTCYIWLNFSVISIFDLIPDSFVFCHYATYSHASLHFRCDLGSCIRDVASCCLPDPSGYCHGDCFSRRHPDEDAEDVDPATHHLQFNHRCCATAHSQPMRYIIITILHTLDILLVYFIFTHLIVRVRCSCTVEFDYKLLLLGYCC